MKYFIEPLGLLLLVTYNWTIEVMGKNVSFILIQNNLTKQMFGRIYLNPSYPSTNIISFPQIVENFTNGFSI